jgi:LemA protein
MTLILVLGAALVLWGVFAFNRLIRLRTQVYGAWADIDVQLKRRHDLIPQLVAAVKAYAGHERATLEAVTALREQAVTIQSPTRLGDVEAALEGALARLFALKEAYPDLKSNENFLQLQRDLVEVEDQLQYARRFYNGAVRDLNTTIGRVPDLVVARAFLFKPAEFFQAEEEERVAPRVEMAP